MVLRASREMLKVISTFSISRIPTFDYAKKGYKIVGCLISDHRIATTEYKDKTVF